MFFVILFVLPLFIDAKIIINIKLKPSKSDIEIKSSGADHKIITSLELNIFNVTREKLNKGMRVYMGKVPNDIFLKEPTVYGDLFQKYKWEPVKRRLRMVKGKVINKYTENTVLKTHEHINNSTTVLKTKRNLFENVENMAKSSWFADGIPSDDINYDVELDLGYGKFKYENKWRSEMQHVSKMPVGVSTDEVIPIKPSQTIVTKLIVTKTILVIELEYKADLIGAAVANYAELYGKYHFWAPSIQNIMKSAKMKNEILSRERIEVTCFLEPRLDVRDKVTGEIIEPPKMKRPVYRILRNKNSTKIIYTRIKKSKKVQQQKQKINN